MAADRKVPAPSNTPGVIPASTFAEATLEEVAALWDNSFMILASVGGSANAITASCPVPLDADKAGQKFVLVPTLANTATGVTLRVDGKTIKTLVDRNGAAPAIGRLQPGIAEVVVDQGATYRLLQDKQVVNAAPKINSYVYQVANGSNGTSSVAGWNTYPLNTQVLNDIGGSSFNAATYRLTLPPNTYEFEADCYCYNSGNALLLYNVTDGVYLTTGAVRRQSYYHSSRSVGRFTIPAAKDFELRINTLAASSLGFTLGIASPSSLPEQYGFLTVKSYN